MKRTVKYDPEAGYTIEIGKRAVVKPLDHTSSYVSNEKYTLTSTAINHNKETGEFETKNSIYKPSEKFQ